ncbi:hypothetical protein J4710_03560 [Staphylococcus xylosus]|uniref:Uncharacterized protein n=1 Tax=Staphylococcus xylosus TaxID=1288 RepID=A0A939NC04_STAXY|nr:hypothetical protein [Staphylococcus xylosus]
MHGVDVIVFTAGVGETQIQLAKSIRRPRIYGVFIGMLRRMKQFTEEGFTFTS